MAQTPIEQVQADLIDEFSFLEDWMDRYQYIIDLGKSVPPMDEALKTEETKVRGCQSQVWLHAQQQGDVLHFEATSDSTIVTGLIATLMRVYNDRTPQEIMTTKPDYIAAIGLDQHLSPTRRNGLSAMLERIFSIASEAAAQKTAIH